MDKQSTPGTQPTLEEIKDNLENWRKTKTSMREPIPTKLWHQAVELCQKHSVSCVAKTLRLSYTDLRKRVYGPSISKRPINKKDPAFIEIKYQQPLLTSEAIVEIEDKSGLKMRICFKGKPDVDLLSLAKVFLESNL